jgi:hypothetical protein
MDWDIIQRFSYSSQEKFEIPQKIFDNLYYFMYIMVNFDKLALNFDLT